MDQSAPHTRDRELFAAIAEGDETAFRVLFQTYAPRLMTYLVRLTKTEAGADEMIQNTFIRVWLARAKLADIETPDKWIFRLATNEAYSFLRVRARHEEVLAAVRAEGGPEPVLQPSDTTAYRELKAAIAEAIARLPGRRRQIYLMSRERGMRQQQIADELGIALSTVKNTLGEAMEAIRQHLTVRGLLMLAVLFTLR
ncbi:MAG TPA: sigma-70 family RNA polymerase sigma factor [Puia sp.]|nr:sigma-70 family RNA polymerase sigma factor [Puia sp.]